MSAAFIKNQLEQLGLTPNKALGQNFLADEEAICRIAGAACPPGMPVLEIGPGLGALTAALMERAPGVTAVEIDTAMIKALNARFPEDKRLRVIHGDFLKTDLRALMGAQGEAFAVAGNLPYYITTPIISRLLCCPLPIERMTLMLQKEAARRFFAGPGTKLYGPVAILTALCYSARVLMTLSPASYYPQPEVDSQVVVLERRAGAVTPPGLPRFLDIAFAMRRKTLVNNLRAAGLSAAQGAALLESCGVSAGARAEELTPEQLALLSERFAAPGANPFFQ